jgi:hypothetical protein
MPNLGASGQLYARSVPSTHPMPAKFLPDASLVFDTLLVRDEVRVSLVYVGLTCTQIRSSSSSLILEAILRSSSTGRE